MRILLAAEWIAIPGHEGAAAHHTGFARAMTKLDNEVHILCQTPVNGVNLNPDDTKTILHQAPRIAFRPKLSRESMPKVREIVNRNKIDIVHKRLDPGSGWAIAALCGTGVPVVGEVNYNPLAFERTGSFIRDVLKPALQSPARLRWARKRYEQVDALVCVSDSIAEWIRRVGINPRRLETIPNGADVERFDPADRGEEIRNRYDGPIVTLVGGLGPRHGIREVVAVSRRFPNTVFMIIGGVEKYAGFIAEMKSVSAGNVVFTGPIDDVRPYLAASSVCLAPYQESIREPHGFCPIKILEYMAAGRPIIASKHSWIAELIEDGKEGLLIDTTDSNALAGALERLLNDDPLRERLASAARARALEQSWRKTAERFVSIYESCLRPTA